MRRFLVAQFLWVALACSSGGSNNDAAGSAGSGATAGKGGTTGSAGTSGNAGTTGGGGRGGTGGSGGGSQCLSFDAPGLVRGTACPNSTPPCYGACDYDGEQYVGCISGSTDFTECYPSCGACP